MSNVFSYTGRVSRDAEVRYLPSGQAVLNVNTAHDVGYGDKKATMWVDVALFGKRAEGQLVTYLKKGQAVFISGELSQSTYRANDGTDKTKMVLTATIIDLVGGKQETSAPQQSQHHEQKSNGYAPDTDDLHF